MSGRTTVLLVGLVILALTSGAAISGERPPKAARDLYRQGQTHLQNEEYQRALVAFDQAIALAPDYALAIFARGHAHLSLGEHAAGVADLDRAADLEPRSPNGSSARCWGRAVAGIDLDQALVFCNDAIGAAPDYAKYDTRGYLRFKRGEYRHAIADYDAALHLVSKSASSRFMRGVSKHRLGDVVGGDRDIARALEDDPKVAARYQRLGVKP